VEPSVAHYEITYIIRATLDDPQVDELATHFADVAKTNGADKFVIERLGKKRLAYEIKKQREGQYLMMQFFSAPDAAKEVMRQMGLHDDVLRALLVKDPFVAPPVL
jgi:small subunit ribosomal protein S6